MKAYQMIYTACGKDKSGAFSVWAKSDSISKKECDEIIKLMNYRKPKNAPYEPTDEEIETLFPKKYGYFALSSGKKCIAQSSYIGKVYSDMDSRSGNFIIHAYVFESLEGFNPYYIFNSNIFKTKLSYKEWHDDPLVEDLPAVELNPLGMPSEMDMKGIIGKHSSVLPAFLEATLKCMDSEEIVLFNDTEIEQSKLYLAIGTLLPNSVLERLTFSTQYSVQAEYSLQTIGAVPVKLRNIFENTPGSPFSYDEEIASGRYGFDFGKGVYCNINHIRRYVIDILDDVQTLRYFDLIKKIDFINDIMMRANCNIDTANAIYNLYRKNYSWFSELDEFNNSLSLAIQIGYVNANEISLDIYSNVIKRGKWNISSSLLPLIQNVYELSDNAQKNDIVFWLYEHLDNFVQSNQNAQAYFTQVQNAISFAWDDFVSNVLSNSKWNSIIAGIRDFNNAYLFYNLFIRALNNKHGDHQIVSNNIVVIVRKIVSLRDADALKQIINASSIMGAAYEKWLMDNAVSSIFTPAVDENSIRYGFEVINSLSDESVRSQCIEKYIFANLNSPLFIPIYVRYYEAERAIYERIEDRFAKKEEFKTFIAKKEAYLFNKESKVTTKLLDNYFNKYYVTGYDSGIYLSKLKSYLDAMPGKEKLQECLRQYSQVRKIADNFCDALSIIEALEKRIYSLPLEELLKLSYPQYETLTEIDERLKRNGRTTSAKYEVLQVLFILTAKLGKKPLEDAIQQGSIYKSMAQAQMTYLIEHHADFVFNAYFAAKKEKKYATDVLINSFLERPFYLVSVMNRLLTPHLEKLNDRNYYELMTDIFGYAFNNNDNLATSLRRFIQNYVDTMKRGEYKKLFKKVQDGVDDKSLKAVNKFIDDYLENHKGFFEGLFGRKKGGDD